MGIWEEFQAYVQANTPRNTRPAVSPARVIDQGLLGGRIGQMPQRAQSMHEGLLGAPAELKQLTSPEFKRKLDEQLKQPAAIDRDKMVSMGMDLLQTTVPLGGLIGHTVYHGSPHKFDKFDMSKIGTGEGAQAYGHGLYFSESPDVARSYQATTTNGFGLPAGENVQGVANVIAMRGEDAARKMYAELGDTLEPTIQRAKQAISDQSAFYKVDIPDEAIPRMLDWDKPLSEQPDVLAKAKQLYDDLGELYPSVGEVIATPGIFDGQHLYQSLINSEKSSERAARTAKSLGIPGIRYLDGSSRNAGQGTSNYVLFDDQMPRILEVNGQPTGLLSWAEEAAKKKRK